MQPIRKETIEAMLEFYEPEARYLKEAWINYPNSKGLFRINKTIYLRKELKSEHFNAGDMIICYNQLGHSTLAEALQQGMIKEMGVKTLEECKEEYVRRWQIITMDNIKFREDLLEKEFYGDVRVVHVSERQDKYIIETKFSFEDEKVEGTMKIMILK